MTAWHPARWPLRTRVALAFVAAAGVSLAVLGIFVHVRLTAALEDRLRDVVSAEADRLEALSGQRRLDGVRTLGGEVHAQLLTAGGDARASSMLVADELLSPGTTTGAPRSEFLDRTVTVLDDDAAADGRRDPERERFLLLVRPLEDGALVVGTSRQDVDEALTALRNQLLIAGPLALAVAGGLGYLVAGAGLRPIDRMRARAATISGRTAGERLPVPGADDELRRLADTLNAMLERLDEGLQRERRFVAEASHDLRTPLTLMRTEIELALTQARPPEELTGALRSVGDQVRRLIALAEDLLARVGPRDGPAIEARPVELAALTSGVVDRFRSSAADRGLLMTARGPVEIRGDATRLDRAVSNLVGNALRHGAGDVVVDVQAVQDGAVLTVTDEGAGFPTPDTLRPAGNGLGLTIVREIARAHGGTVEVQRVDGRTCVRMVLASPRM